MWQGVHILVNRADRLHDHCFLDSLGQLYPCRIHQRGVERSTHLQRNHPSAFFLQKRTGSRNSVNVSADHHLTVGVVIGRNNHSGITLRGNLCTGIFNDLVLELQYSSHSGRLDLAGLLHGKSTLCHQLQTLLKAQRSGSGQCGKLSQRVSCHHIGIKAGDSSLSCLLPELALWRALGKALCQNY